MASAYDAFVVVGFASWILCSIYVQRFPRRSLRYDWLGLLPNCRFFAPRPISTDLCIYLRRFDAARLPLGWSPLLSPRKSWWCFIWNPDQKLRKAQHDVLQWLQSYANAPLTWHLSYPYLVVLNAATAVARQDENCKAVQFMIACYAGYEETVRDVLFVSHVHEVTR